VDHNPAIVIVLRVYLGGIFETCVLVQFLTVVGTYLVLTKVFLEFLFDWGIEYVELIYLVLV
jgi:hypothetical protein